jgi:ubiquinone/menaquinone biosynthesis C-methylase UbiE
VSDPDSTRRSVREFYDRFGWLPEEQTGGFKDGTAFDDLRPVSAPYRRRANRRIEEALGSGSLLLDAASGPVQYDDYVAFSSRFEHRVCLDFSLGALRAARSRLGAHALCVCADVARLPFRDATFDGVVSLHTLYHVPEGDQPRALRELCRMLVLHATGVVVVSWPRSGWDRVWTGVARRLARAHQALAGEIPPLYFHPRGKEWLEQSLPENVTAEIACWRSVSVELLRRMPNGRGGRLVLSLLSWLESRLPRVLGRRGLYPMIVLRKTG